MRQSPGEAEAENAARVGISEPEPVQDHHGHADDRDLEAAPVEARWAGNRRRRARVTSLSVVGAQLVDRDLTPGNTLRSLTAGGEP